MMASAANQDYEDMEGDWEHLSSDNEEHPPQGNEDDEPVYFKETLKQLEALAHFLACVKCNELPQARVFTLGKCTHKYCEKCVTYQMGKDCLVCGEPSCPKDVKADLFATSLLEEIPAVYQMLEQVGKGKNTGEEEMDEDDLEELPSKKNLKDCTDNGINSCDLKSMNILDEDSNSSSSSPPRVGNKPSLLDNSFSNCLELDVENQKEVEVQNKDRKNKQISSNKGKEKRDEVVNEEEQAEDLCTPASRVLPPSPDPDIMEETPHNKANLSVIEARRATEKKKKGSGKKVRPIVLDLSPLSRKDQNKEDETLKGKETTTIFLEASPLTKMNKSKKNSVAVNIIDEILFSDGDEELFRSQSSDNGTGNENQLPVLTPQVPTKQASASDEKQQVNNGKIEDDTRKDEESRPALKRKFFQRSRKSSSNEKEPPSLTPQLKPETAKETKEKEESKPKLKRSTSASKLNITFKNKIKQMTETEDKQEQEEPSMPIDSKKATRKKKITIKSSTPKPKKDDSSFVDDGGIEKDKETTKKTKGRPKKTPSTPLNTSLNTSIVAPKDIDKRNAKGETALHIACRAGQFDKVKYLIEEGFDINAADNVGWTPLHEAITGKASKESKPEFVRYFCEKGCNVNAVGGPEDDTSLHSAVLYRLEKCVEILLEFGASPNIRNNLKKLPIEVAIANDSKVIIGLLKEKMDKLNSPVTCIPGSSSVESVNSNYNSALSFVGEEDPAVLQVMLKKAVLYFAYDVEDETIEATRNVLKLRVSEKLASTATHIVYKTEMKNKAGFVVPLSTEYLYGLANGMWQVSHQWIEKSIKESKCSSPSSFEVTSDDTLGDATNRCPTKSRVNKEKGNPGLFDGFNVYLYKTCGYAGGGNKLKLGKRELTNIIQGAGGKVTNREPNPETIDPLEAPLRFHANSCTSNSQSPFEITSHIILYDENEPIPKKKMYDMEHVKTLKSSWIIESLAKFTLLDPQGFR